MFWRGWIAPISATLHNWMAAHPEFLDAMTRAKAWAQRWWEDKGQLGMEQQGFNASVWSRIPRERGGTESWRQEIGRQSFFRPSAASY